MTDPTTSGLTQLRLAFPRAQVTKAMFSAGGQGWSVDLSVLGSPFALPVASALAVGAPARPIVQKDLAECFTPGFERDGYRELFLRPNAIPGASGILTLEQKDNGEWSAKLANRLVPYVLTKDAVTNEELPPFGTSGLPDSLARCVPAQYRYWETADRSVAANQRAALVESDFFAESLLKVVDGEIRLCVQQLYLYEPEEAPVAPELAPDASPPVEAPPGAAPTGGMVDPAADALGKMLEGFAGTVYQPMNEDTPEARNEALRAAALDPSGLVLLDTDSEAALVAKALVVSGPQGEWCLAATDSPEAREAFSSLGAAFIFKGDLSRTLFVASIAPPLGSVTWVPAPEHCGASPKDTALFESLTKRVVSVVKATDGTAESGEERYVLGVVLEPELIDAQQDIYDEATIRTAAHKFMTDFRTVGLMHKGAVNDKVKILESYITPVDFEIDGAPVKKGAWVMAVRVLDDALWTDVKSGALTGFSIGGTAIRKPDLPAPIDL